MKKVLICLLAFIVLFVSSVPAFASFSFDALECPSPDPSSDMGSDHYLVWYDYTQSSYFVWFMSRYHYFYFIDNNTAKEFNARDMYGGFYKLDTSYDTYTPCELTLQSVYNNNRSDILFIYSTHEIKIGSTVFITQGFQDGYIPETPTDPDTPETPDEDNSGILSGLSNVVNSIKNLGSNIQTHLLSLGTSIVSGIGDFFKGLVFPDEGYIEGKIKQLQGSFSNLLGFDVSEVTDLFDVTTTHQSSSGNIHGGAGVSFGDVNKNDFDNTDDVIISSPDNKININGLEFEFKAFDNKFLLQGIEFFRPIIRGFVVLMLVFFNMNQILHLIGQGSLSEALKGGQHPNDNWIFS